MNLRCFFIIWVDDESHLVILPRMSRADNAFNLIREFILLPASFFGYVPDIEYNISINPAHAPESDLISVVERYHEEHFVSTTVMIILSVGLISTFFKDRNHVLLEVLVLWSRFQ